MNGPPQKPTTACSSSSSRADEAHRLEDRRERLLGLGHAQPLDVGARRAPAPATTGPDALDELDVDAHPEDGRHDVREHHGRVDAVPAHRLERHLGAELGLARRSRRARAARGSRGTPGSERPAWRMNQTGVRSTGSRRRGADEQRLHRAPRLVRRMERGRRASRPRRAARRALARRRARRGPGGRAATRDASRSRTPAARRGARAAPRASSSPTTGSTSAATRSSGTAPRTPLAHAVEPGASVRARRRGARADPARPLPARVRPRRGAPLLVRRGRQPAARARRCACGRGSSGARSPCAGPTRRARRAGRAPCGGGAGGRGLARAGRRAGARLVAARARRARGGLRGRRRLGRGRGLAGASAAPPAARALGARRRARTRRSTAPLLCPSALVAARRRAGRSCDGLPALEPPRGRAVALRRPDRAQSSTAIRSSTRVNTHAPSDERDARRDARGRATSPAAGVSPAKSGARIAWTAGVERVRRSGGGRRAAGACPRRARSSSG